MKFIVIHYGHKFNYKIEEKMHFCEKAAQKQDEFPGKTNGWGGRKGKMEEEEGRTGEEMTKNGQNTKKSGQSAKKRAENFPLS